MINEGAKILEEGMAIRASRHRYRVDQRLWLAVYRGGPMFYGQHEAGLKNALDKLKKYAAGNGWKTTPLLEELVAEGKGFARIGQ